MTELPNETVSDPDARKPGRGRSLLARLVWPLTASLTAAAITGGVVLATAALHQRAASEPDPEPSPPLPVATIAAHPQASYEVEERFAGLIEPARETALAFERGGQVVAVLAEEGDRLAQGQVAARLDDAVLSARRERLQADRKQLEARLQLAERTEERQQAMLGRGFATDQSHDEARFEAEAIRAQIASIDAQIREIEVDLAKSALTAPFAGAVVERLVDEGAVVAAGTPLLRLLETGRPMARIGAPPEIAAQLKIGERQEVRVGARVYPARLVSSAPAVDPSVRTVDLLFALDLDAAAPPAMGEVARLRLRRPVEGRGVWLPLSALQEGEKGLWTVYTLGRDGENGFRVGQAAVEILHVEGERVFVRGALKEGDRVVSGGVNRIARGQLVALAR